MNPTLAKKLMSKVPELKDFIAFLSEEALKLNKLDDIKLTEPKEIAIEVLARQRAYEVIVKILDPLVNIQEINPMGSSNKDFVV